MPATNAIQSASALNAGQAMKLLQELRSCDQYREQPELYPDLSARVMAQVDRKAAITAASNATPVVVTAPGHSFAEGEVVTVAAVDGNMAANGSWIVGSPSGDNLTLTGSAGNGNYTSGGVVYGFISQSLAAIVQRLDLLKDNTYDLRGGGDPLIYSTEKDRALLLRQALDALYSSDADASNTRATRRSATVPAPATW